MRIWRIVSFGILVSACGIPILFGQQDKGTIVGLVEDSSGASIPNAKVTLRNAGTGETRTTNTDAGRVRLHTPDGRHLRRHGGSAGFQTQVKRYLELQVQQRLDVQFTLPVGAESRVIEVTDTAPPLQTADSSLGQVVEARAVVNLPLNGRNIYQLIGLGREP